MMALVLSSGHLPFVAAVLRDCEGAERYLADLPAPVRDRSTVTWREDLTLPCYLAEDAAGLRPLSAEEAQSYVSVLARKAPDVDGVYGILYRLDGEFLPTVAGRDEMGRLPHIH